MKHYFTKDVKKLVPLIDFQVSAGVPARKTERKRVDTFTLRAKKYLDTDGGFCVLREDAMMYHCEAITVSATEDFSFLTIAGNVKKSLVAPDKERVLAQIKKMKKGRGAK